MNSSHFQPNVTIYGTQTILNLTTTQVRTVIHHSLRKWSEKSLLTFREDHYNPKADIKVSFMYKDHSDGYEFDGKGNVLAHAFYPSGGNKGVVHLDVEETWDMKSLEQVLTHEFGHTFGIGHSSDPKSIMYPWYSSSIDDLNDDDKNAVESLYGLKNKWAYNPWNPRNGTHYVPVQKPHTPMLTPRFDPQKPHTPTTTSRYYPKKYYPKPDYPVHKPFTIPNTLLNIVNSSINNLYVYLTPEKFKTVSLYNLTDSEPRVNSILL
jgi:matrix metalloproteinase-16 (membrane-inserted)